MPNLDVSARPRLALAAFALALSVFAACGGGGGGGGSPTAPTPTPPPPAPPSPPQSVVLGTATLRGVNGHRTEGTARLVRLGEQHTLELSESFRTNSQVIEVRLCRNDRCTGEFLDLGPLKSLRGAQTYEVPSTGPSFSHVIIWCVPFRVPIGVGELR